MMKRFLAYLLSISLILLPMPPMAQAEETQVLVASGTVTQANMKISAVDGTAFVDLTASTFTDSTPVASGTVTQANTRIATIATGALLELVGVDLSAHIGKYIRLRTGGKRIEGFIGAAGGEAFTESVVGGNFTVDLGFIKEVGWTVTGGKAVATNVSLNFSIYQTTGQGLTQINTGELVRTSLDIDSTDAAIAVRLQSTNLTSQTTTGTKIEYRTATENITNVQIRAVAAGLDGVFDNFSVGKTTDLAVTGAKIYSTSALSTQSWAYTDTGYDPNASAGVTYEIFTPNPLPLKKGHLLKLKAVSNGAVIQGFPKLAGTAETESAEIAIGTCTAAKLYKITATEANHFGTGKVIGNYFTSVGTETLDANNKVLEISTPGATGVTISTTKGGSTMNWPQKDASFNYNDTSYSYEIWKILGSPVVDSDTCANADATLVQTDGSAAFTCTGIDDSAYYDGKHWIGVYDAAGVGIIGFYKSAGAGAVVTAHSGATQNWLRKGAGFSTAGDYVRKVYSAGD